jgi:hypothetical protein
MEFQLPPSRTSSLDLDSSDLSDSTTSLNPGSSSDTSSNFSDDTTSSNTSPSSSGRFVSILDQCPNKRDPVTLDNLDLTTDDRVVVLTLPTGEKQCYFVQSLCNMAKSAAASGEVFINISHNETNKTTEIDISTIASLLQSRCSVGNTGHTPLYKQVARDLVVKMLLLIRALNNNWLIAELSDDEFFLADIIFTEEDRELLHRLEYGKGHTIKQAFGRLNQQCGGKDRGSVCTKHGVAPLYRSIFFGNSETLKEQDQLFDIEVNELKHKVYPEANVAAIIKMSPAEAKRVNQIAMQEARPGKEDQQAKKAAAKQLKLAGKHHKQSN